MRPQNFRITVAVKVDVAGVIYAIAFMMSLLL